MKKSIHPTYYPNAKIICACGHTFTTGSTVKEIHVEICAACHPFYTGKSKVVDTAGRVERFKKLVEQKKAVSRSRKGKKAKKVHALKRKEEKSAKKK